MRQEGNRVNTQLTNVERIEVLKGPSSALYGGNALGATVNLIRKKPSAASQYDFVGAFGNWQTARTAFGAGGRLAGNEKTLYRFDFGAESREGYRHDNAKRVTVTPSLAWRLGTSDQLNVYYTFNHDGFGGDAGLPLVDTGLGVPTKDNVLDVPRDRNYRTPQDDATSNDHNVQLVYARQLTDTVGFRDTLGYRHFDDEYFLSEEVDFVAPSTIERYYLYFKHHRRPLMNIAEVTTHVRRGVEQDLLFGWEAQRYHNFTTLPEEDFFAAEPIDAFNPVETQGPSDLTTASVNVFTNVTNALYANDHITLGPRVKALLGGRYDIYRRTSHSDAVDNGQQIEGAIAKREANAFTGRVGLVYQPGPAVDLYGSWANAFIPQTVAQPDGSSLDPVTGSQFEFGQRFRLLDHRAELTTSIYRLNKQHVPFRRSGNVYVQAGEIRSAGFEAELESTLASNVRLNASYAFTDAEFLDYEESPGVNLRGNTPSFAPRHTANLWAGYDWSNGFGANLGYRYFGEVFADSGNEFAVDGYGTLALALRYRRGPVQVSLNLNNLTDTEYLVPHQDYLQVYPGEPVNALLTVRISLR